MRFILFSVTSILADLITPRLGDHLLCVTGSCTQPYSALSDRSYNEVKTRLMRSSDFISVVVVPWVLDDFRQFFVS